jgi:rubrerythrin
MKKLIILCLILVYSISSSFNLFCQQNSASDKKEPSESKTIQNIKKIIISELQSYQFYKACGKKANEEGYSKIAKQFYDIAEMENEHYKRFKELLTKLKVDFKETKPNFVILSTKDNIKTSYNLELVAIKVYERSINQANIDLIKEAVEDYNWAMAMEKVHSDIFKKILENFDSYKDK